MSDHRTEQEPQAVEPAAPAAPASKAPALNDPLARRRAEERAKRQAEQEEAQEFLVFLSRLRRGRVALDWARALADLTKAVRKLKRKGTLKIEITIAPVGKTGSSVTFSQKVTVKKPETHAEEDVLYFDKTDEGKLVIDHPDSMPMFTEDELTGGEK
jgi:hypothetical protein